MKHFCWKQAVFLGLATVFTFLSGMPTAEAPVKVYENRMAMVEIFAVFGVVFAWIFLAVSERRRRDLFAVFVLNLLNVFFLCRALNALEMCYLYYVTG